MKMEIKRHLAVYHIITKMEYQANHSKEQSSSNYLVNYIVYV